MFLQIKKIAKKLDIKNIACGDNFDDLKRFRPGRDAGVEEKILSPLCNAKLKKDEIRILAKTMGLSVWNKTSVSCLCY